MSVDAGRKSDGLISEELAKRISLQDEENINVGVVGEGTIIEEIVPEPTTHAASKFFTGSDQCAFEDVCRFLSAVMRKSYQEALTLANHILTIQPNNKTVQEFLPVLEEILLEEEKEAGDVMSTSDSDSSARSDSEEEEEEEDEFEVDDIEGHSSSSASESSDSEGEGSTESSETGSSAESISSGSETSDTSIDDELTSFDSVLSFHDDKDEEEDIPEQDSDDDGYET